MENERTEAAWSSLEKTLQNFHENVSDSGEVKAGNSEDTVNDGGAKDNGEKQNSESASISAESDFTSQASGIVQKRPSAEEIAKNWQELGVKRCPNCKFRTESDELFKNHYTTCPAVKSTGTIKLLYKNTEFSCSVCDDTWTNRAEFEEHIVCHLQESPYVCLSCQNKKFASRQQIEIHTKIEHPSGGSRCGLKGMKIGRKYTEELIQNGTISIQGKLSVPKTPKNHISQINSLKEKTSGQQPSSETVPPVVVNTSVQESSHGPSASIAPTVVSALQPQVIPGRSTLNVGSNTIHYKPEVLSVNSSVHCVSTKTLTLPSTVVSASKITSCTNTVPSSHPQQVTIDSQPVMSRNTSVSETVAETASSRPMPPARTNINVLTNISEPHLYTSKGGTFVRVPPSEVAKSKHLDSLFGELNRTTNIMQPTTVSQKIKDIANPAHDVTKKEGFTKSIPYNLKTITEYTCTAAVRTVTPSVSSMPAQNLFLVQVGQPVMQTGGPVALPNTGIVYQSQNHGHVLVPIQPVHQTAQITSIGTGPNIRGQLTTAISTTPQNHKVFSQVPPNPVVLTSVPAVVNTTSSSNRNTPKILSNILSKPVTLVNSPKEGIKDRRDAETAKLPVITMPSSEEDQLQLPKKYLFKIKLGQGFVCEYCKKFTKDEYVFRRHVWDHFHGYPFVACKTCLPSLIAKKAFLECKLVNNIVCNLIKHSAKEQQATVSDPVKFWKIGDHEVIDITDDEKDGNTPQNKKEHATEVIVLDDDDENADGQGPKIQISATFSLSDIQSMEQMAKKDQNYLDNKEESQSMGKDIEEKCAQNTVKSGAISRESGVQAAYSNVPKSKQNSEDVTISHVTDKVESEVSVPVSSENQKQVVPTMVNSDTNNSLEVNTKGNLKAYLEKKGHYTTCSTTKLVTGSQVYQESEDDEDGNLKGNLLDKSLSEPGETSEELVSQVLETNLKVYDPSNKALEETSRDETKMNTDNAASEHQNLPKTDTTVKQDKQAMGISGDTNIDLVNIPGKNKFDSEILSKQSHNAFYLCGFENCSFTCMSSSKYREHIKCKVHGDEYNYVCGHCGQKDYTEDTHVRHIFTHANCKTFLLYKCPIRLCKYKTNVLPLYAEHLRAHPTEELNMKCVYCHKTFPTVDSLVQHLKQNLLKFVICPYCSFKFINRYVVMMHIKHFHPEKLRIVSVTSQIVCNEREINFYVPPKSKAVIHSYTSAKDTPDADNLDIPALLEDFQKAAEKESENGDEDALSLPEEDQSDYKEREKTSKRQKESKLQTASQKPIKTKGKSDVYSKNGPKSLECPKCSYLSYNQSLYAKHLSIHDTEPEREKRFVCNLCPKGCNSLPHFKTHVGNHVGKHVIKVFNCTACAYSSNQKCHIMDHVSDAHIEETVYTIKEEVVESNHSECSYCSFKARTAEQVFAHQGAVHNIDPKMPLGKSSDKANKDSENMEGLEESGASSNSGGKSTKKKKYKYHCEYCSDFFKHKSNLKEHIVNDHKDTENKQFIFFKCKYCVYTSTMKDMIIGHLGEEHPGKDLRILRKVEMIESLDLDTAESKKELEKDCKTKNKEGDHDVYDSEKTTEANKVEIVIPDGNIFRHIFSCPKCPFTSNLRIKTMKHLKEHPEIVPVRPDQQKLPSKKTARKSSSSSFSRVDVSTGRSSLFQQIPKSSEPLQNPFIAVKESVKTQNTSSLDTQVTSPSKESYILGEQKLHAALSACFIPDKKDMKYQCRICKQKIFKKFVLHRHILDHLKIVFFKCKYCEEGSIEKTLMAGHIQKDHPSRPVLYDSVDLSILEQEFKEKIFSQDFNDTVDIYAASKSQKDNVDHVKNSGIVKKAVNEFQTIDDDSESEDDVKEEPSKSDDNLKCPKCRYVAKYKYNFSLHLDSHNDPSKVFTCSVCDYRGDKFAVIKHVYRVFHLTQAKVLKNGQSLYDNPDSQTDKGQANKSRNESKPPAGEIVSKEEARRNSVDSDKSLTNAQGKQLKLETLSVSKSGVFEMRTIFKCKVCGEKRDSRSALYHHFRTSKCGRPVYKCSLCSFRNTAKSAIQSHSRKRHNGKRVSVLSLPLSSNYREYKFPVRQADSVLKDLTERKSEEKSITVENKQSPKETVKKIKEIDTVENGQIRCQICTKYVCDSSMKLQFHVNTVHQGAVLQCQKCSYKSPLVKHMINHCKNLHYQRVALYGIKPTTPSKKKETTVEISSEKTPKIIGGTKDQVVFKCPKCNLELKTQRSVLTHLYVHFNYKPYSCRYCGKHMSRSDHVRQHTENLHEGKPVVYDTNIDEAIEARVKKIYESVKRSVVKQRIMLGKNRPSYLDQMDLTEDGIRRKGNIFYCDYCPYKSDRRATVRNHVSKVHAGISKKRPLEIDSDTESPVAKVSRKDTAEDVEIGSCATLSSEEEEENSKQFDEATPLKYKVIKSPDGSKKFQCSVCDYVNAKIKNLKIHFWRVHSSILQAQAKREGVLKCFFCSYTSAHSSSGIYKHIKQHHPSKSFKYINRAGEVVSRDSLGSSPVLKGGKSSPARSTSSVSPARSHTESVGSDVSPFKPVKRQTGVTKYICCFCGFSTESFFHFRLHSIAHQQYTQVTSELDEESRMSCGFCTYIAKNTFDLCSHVASHMGEMRYKCAYCDYPQYEKFKVQSHIKHCHADRDHLVFDRELRQMCNGTIRLVNFNPVVELDKGNYGKKKRRFKRIKIGTEESSDSSLEVEDSKSSSGKTEKASTENSGFSQFTRAINESLAKKGKREDSKISGGESEKASAEESVFFQSTRAFNESLAEKGKVDDDKSSSVETEKASVFSQPSQKTNESLTAKVIEEVRGKEQTLFSESVTPREKKDRDQRKSTNLSSVEQLTEPENNAFGETQMFRIESQPFSPSDLMCTEDSDLDETIDENVFTQSENHKSKTHENLDCDSAKVKFSVVQNNVETDQSLGTPSMINNVVNQQTDCRKEKVENSGNSFRETKKDETSVNTNEAVEKADDESVNKISLSEISEQHDDRSMEMKTTEITKKTVDICLVSNPSETLLNKNEIVKQTDVSCAEEHNEKRLNEERLKQTDQNVKNEESGSLSTVENVAQAVNLEASEQNLTSVIRNEAVADKTRKNDENELCKNPSGQEKEILPSVNMSYVSEQVEPPSKDHSSKEFVEKSTDCEGKAPERYARVENKEEVKPDVADSIYSVGCVEADSHGAKHSVSSNSSSRYGENCVETSKYSNFDLLINRHETDSFINSACTSCKTDESEKVSSSTNAHLMKEPDTTENEGPKSPRNVFDSISNVNNSFDSESPLGSSLQKKEMENKLNDKKDTNVFEKFTPETEEGKSLEWSQKDENDDSSCNEGQDNIFEKLANEAINTSSGIEKESMSDTVNSEDLDKNIFEKFGGVESEKMNKVSAKDGVDEGNMDMHGKISGHDDNKKDISKDGDTESNIFVKFSSENLELQGQVETEKSESQKNADVEGSNIFSKFSDNDFEEEKRDSESQEVTEKDNLFDKFSVKNLDSQLISMKENETSDENILEMDTDSKTSNTRVENVSENEKNVEDMEVDELILTIEKTVNEGSANKSSFSQEENTDMETD